MSQIDPWSERWNEGRIGFHLERIHPLLLKHRKELHLDQAGQRVLVPLCGKSLDMRYLVAEGHQAIGVEAVPEAVEEFFREAGLKAEVHREGDRLWHSHGDLRIQVGDIFELELGEFAPVDAIWDRAALIALESEHRQRYVDILRSALKPDGRVLLVALGYDQDAMQGPPWSVPEEEVRSLWSSAGSITVLERHDVLDGNPRFKESGLSQVTETVYLIEP